jgi:ubiquinone/menaquinone biosynthesis C-methylase UbiE
VKTLGKDLEIGNDASNVLLGRDKIVGPVKWPPSKHIKDHLDVIVGVISEGLSTESVLDLGCGDGSVDLLLADKYPNLKITATDLEAHPQWKVNKFKNLKFKKSSVYDLTFKENSFDIIIMKDVLHHLPNPEAAVINMLNIAKKKIVIIEANRYNPVSYMRMVKFAGHDHFSQKKLKRVVGVPHTLHTIETHVWPESLKTAGKIHDYLFSISLLKNVRNYNIITINII